MSDICLPLKVQIFHAATEAASPFVIISFYTVLSSKKTLQNKGEMRTFVLGRGLEPPSLAAPVPKTGAYTNSATPAFCGSAHEDSNLGPSP